MRVSFNPKFIVQAVLIKRKPGMDLTKANKIIKDHNFKPIKQVHITDKYL